MINSADSRGFLARKNTNNFLPCLSFSLKFQSSLIFRFSTSTALIFGLFPNPLIPRRSLPNARRMVNGSGLPILGPLLLLQYYDNHKDPNPTLQPRGVRLPPPTSWREWTALSGSLVPLRNTHPIKCNDRDNRKGASPMFYSTVQYCWYEVSSIISAQKQTGRKDPG
jgi:hypothetical protein